MAELEREWLGDSNDPVKFAADCARSCPPVPTGSNDLQSGPTGSQPPVPTGSGDLAPQHPLQNLLLTIDELEQMYAKLLNFTMIFINIP